MKKWPWQLYGIILTLIVFSSASDLFSADSPLRTYYTILIAFDQHYIILFTLNILAVIFELLSPLIVFLYALNIKTSPTFWRFFFWLRLLFSAIGHSYDRQFLVASFHQSISYGFACIGVLIIPLVPSYVAHYLYVFYRKPSPTQ
jgi:hypothetical protein